MLLVWSALAQIWQILSAFWLMISQTDLLVKALLVGHSHTGAVGEKKVKSKYVCVHCACCALI